MVLASARILAPELFLALAEDMASNSLAHWRGWSGGLRVGRNPMMDSTPGKDSTLEPPGELLGLSYHICKAA